MTKAANTDFYAKIKAFYGSSGISDHSNFCEVPEDWYVIVADVKGSTLAIREGRYKEVNLVGASAIAAVLNLFRPMEIPYVFGGDGATFVVPSLHVADCMAVLGSVQKMSMREFQLVLRIGAVCVADVIREGVEISIAKQALSEGVCQAIFSGGGLAKAEDLVKMREASSEVSCIAKEANYQGLECRWQPLKSEHGEIFSVLVQAEAKNITERFRIYKELIEEVEAITGGGQLVNPVSRNKLKLTLNPLMLRKEQKVRTTSLGSWERLKYLITLVFYSAMGKIFFFFKLNAAGTNWPLYKEEVVKNSDFWKFDDMLRFVVDVSSAQKRALLSCFEMRFIKRELCYGVHSSSSALLTCLVFSRQNDHIHFVDGGDGGYAMAADDFKKRKKTLHSPPDLLSSHPKL
jgi:hypothetical protein